MANNYTRYKFYVIGVGGTGSLLARDLPKLLLGTSHKMMLVDGDIEAALNKIIATPYSHGDFDGIKGFSTTVSYFEYLEENPFPYKLLRKLNRKLRDVKV